MIRGRGFELIMASRTEIKAYASQAKTQNRESERSKATEATKRSQKGMVPTDWQPDTAILRFT